MVLLIHLIINSCFYLLNCINQWGKTSVYSIIQRIITFFLHTCIVIALVASANAADHYWQATIDGN